jgi:hypothetical protein
VEKKLEAILKKLVGKENFVTVYWDKKNEIVWAYYAILNPSSYTYLEFSENYGLCLDVYASEKNRDRKYRIAAINLTAPFDYLKLEYNIRELVATVIHEIIHCMGVDSETQTEYLTEKLLMGYKFSVIKLYKK